MMRRTVSTVSAWEPVVGYSRAVRVGNVVHVSGTMATGADGSLVGVGDAYAQARQALANIEAVLEAPFEAALEQGGFRVVGFEATTQGTTGGQLTQWLRFTAEAEERA